MTHKNLCYENFNFFIYFPWYCSSFRCPNFKRNFSSWRKCIIPKSKGTTILSINPNVGYFVADRFAVGLNAGINSLSDLTFISLGPNLRGYFLTSEKGSIFATAGFNYVRVNINNNSDSSTGYNLGIGYAVFLNKAIALEISSNYSKLGSSADNIVIGNSETGIFSINVGFQIHFNKNN